MQLYRAEDVRAHSTKTGLKISGDQKALVTSHPDATLQGRTVLLLLDDDDNGNDHHHHMI